MKAMAHILGVPDDYELVCFLLVGIAKTEAQRPDKNLLTNELGLTHSPPLKNNSYVFIKF